MNQDILDKLKKLENRFNRRDGQVDTVAPDRTVPRVKEKEISTVREQYQQVNEDHPEESPYVVKQATRTAKDQVMVDDTNKSPLLIEIENVMAADFGELYQTMTPPQQQQFRTKGEAVASQIEQLTLQFKITAKKVLKLIQEWLRLIPGVNTYFLEQESKIKTDDIMKFSRKYYHERDSGHP